jgi:hypothetical protein
MRVGVENSRAEKCSGFIGDQGRPKGAGPGPEDTAQARGAAQSDSLDGDWGPAGGRR